MQQDLGISIFVIVVLILSVIMHEIAHGYAALLLGDQTAKRAGRLTLNPIAHIDPIGSILLPAILVLTNAGFMYGWAKPVPYNPYNLRNQRWGEAIVGFAGVFTNFVLAIVFAGVTRLAGAYGYDMFAGLASLVVLVNLSLGCFNLIPIPPLDGYTVLRGILPGRFSLALRDLQNKVAQGGIIVFVLFLFVFSYVLATPFYTFVEWLFRLLIGQ